MNEKIVVPASQQENKVVVEVKKEESPVVELTVAPTTLTETAEEKSVKNLASCKLIVDPKVLLKSLHVSSFLEEKVLSAAAKISEKSRNGIVVASMDFCKKSGKI